MNTIKMSKVLALIVVVAMVMAVMPVAFAATDEVLVATATGLKYRVVDDTNLIENGSFEGADGSFSKAGWYTALDVKNNNTYGTTEIGDPYTTDHFVALDGTKAYIDAGKNGVLDEEDPNEVFDFALDIPDGNWALGTRWNDGSQDLCSIRNVFDVNEAGVYALSYQVKYNGNDVDGGYLKVSKTTHKDANSTDEATREELDAQGAGTVTNEWKTVVGIVEITDPEAEFVQFWGRWFTQGKPGYIFDDFKLRKVEEIAPDASVTVNIVDENGEELLSDIAGTGTEYYKGDVFDGEGVSFDEYLVNGGKLYKVAKPDAITLDTGINDYNLVATLYKTVVDETVAGDNAGFEDGINGWTEGFPEEEYQILVKSDDEPRVTEGNQSLWLKGVNQQAGTTFGRSWTVKEGTSYFVSFDFLPTKSKATQYMWLYTTSADGNGTSDDADATLYADVADSGSGKLQQMNGGQVGTWETKQFIVSTTEGQTKLGFATAWVANDTSPVLDNFKIVELADLSTDVSYTVVVTTDGTESGTELAKLEGLEGTVGDDLGIVAGQIGNKRVGKDYYTNKASEEKLSADKTTYYVGADVVASIIGTEPVTVTTVGDYDPMLPVTVKTVVDKPEVVTPEVLPVTWEGTTGTVDDTDLTVTAEINALDATFDPIAGQLVSSKNVQNQQHDAYVDMYRFPSKVEDKFTAEFTIINTVYGDNHVGFLENNDDTSVGIFGPERIHLVLEKAGISYRDKNGKNKVMDMELLVPYTFIVDADIVAGTYDLTVRNDNTNEIKTVEDVTFRTAGAVEGVSFHGNVGTTANDAFVVTKFVVNAPSVTDVPAAADVKANLDYMVEEVVLKDAVVGEDGTETAPAETVAKDTLVIKYTTDAENATLRVYANDINNTLVGEAVVEAGKSVVLVPKNANVTYTARLVDTATGFMIGGTECALAPMVIDDIAANLAEYSEAGKMARVAQAVAALNQIGAVYELTEDGAKFNDGRDEFITADVVPTEDSKTIVNLTVNEGMFANGFGFSVGIKAGKLDGDVNAAVAAAEAVEGQVFRSISVAEDGTVTVQAADGTVYTFSLADVEIEFVGTEAAEAAADDVDAAVGMTDEL